MFRVVEDNRPELVRLLLDKGSNPNVRLVRCSRPHALGRPSMACQCWLGYMVLPAPCGRSNGPYVQLEVPTCLRLAPMLLCTVQSTGQLPLETAARLGHRDILRQFVLAGANPGSGDVRA